jgi:ATP-dependent DNA helicase DinG
MWLREQELPAIVIVPEREVWQPVSRLAYVLTQMQRHQNGILVSQLNAMQRNRFKQQIVVEKMNLKKGLEQQYDRLLHDL